MANTNAASKWFVCGTPQNTKLTKDEYEALEWTEIKGIGNVGETGKSTNMLTYNTWADDVVQKAKGLTDAGSPEFEVARSPEDPGQNILRTAGAVGNNNNYAFKEVRADGPVGGVGTTFYNRGLVGGPRRPNGGNEDFDLEVFSVGFQQEEIIVNPTSAGNPPVMTVAPEITGTAQAGETLTCDNGTFTGDATLVYTHQWFANGTAITGATDTTYALTAADVGKVFSCRVIARNNAGSAVGFSNTTSAVIAE